MIKFINYCKPSEESLKIKTKPPQGGHGDNRRKKVFIMDIIKLQNKIGAISARSAWRKGVKEYAKELVEALRNIDGSALHNRKELLNIVLNGAENWDEYSWGGCSLICDEDICLRLCSPSEVKRTHSGKYRPNKSEEWLDVQRRALRQAFNLLCDVLGL